MRFITSLINCINCIFTSRNCNICKSRRKSVRPKLCKSKLHRTFKWSPTKARSARPPKTYRRLFPPSSPLSSTYGTCPLPVGRSNKLAPINRNTLCTRRTRQTFRTLPPAHSSRNSNTSNRCRSSSSSSSNNRTRRNRFTSSRRLNPTTPFNCSRLPTTPPSTIRSDWF